MTLASMPDGVACQFSMARSIFWRMQVQRVKPPLEFVNGKWEDFTCYMSAMASMSNWDVQLDDEETFLDRFRGCLAPPGHMEYEWAVFMDYVKAIAWEMEEMGVSALPVMVPALNPMMFKQEPSTPDMLMRAAQSLLMPRQLDKTSSVEERQRNAAAQARNPPMPANMGLFLFFVFCFLSTIYYAVLKCSLQSLYLLQQWVYMQD